MSALFVSTFSWPGEATAASAELLNFFQPFSISEHPFDVCLDKATLGNFPSSPGPVSSPAFLRASPNTFSVSSSPLFNFWAVLSSCSASSSVGFPSSCPGDVVVDPSGAFDAAEVGEVAV